MPLVLNNSISPQQANHHPPSRASAIYVLSLHNKSGRPSSEETRYTTRNSEDIFQNSILFLLYIKHAIKKKKRFQFQNISPQLRIVFPRISANLSTRHFRPLLQTYPDLTLLSYFLRELTINWPRIKSSDSSNCAKTLTS